MKPGHVARAVAVLVITLFTPAFARADDAGPANDVRALRRDVPIVLSPFLIELERPVQDLQIEGIVVSGDLALIQWLDAQSNHRELTEFHKTYGRWWYNGTALASCTRPDSCLAIGSKRSYTGGPSPTFLIETAGLPRPLVDLARDHLTTVAAAAQPRMDVDLPLLPELPASPPWPGVDLQTPASHPYYQAIPHASPYQMWIMVPGSNATSSAHIVSLVTRMPTLEESWATPGQDAYFFFSGTVDAESTVTLVPGAVISVIFPFALDPSLHYQLLLAGPTPSAVIAFGVLQNNVLAFALPAFSLQPGSSVTGEIAGD